MGFLSGVVSVIILFEETREFIPIECPPTCVQAGEKFEFVIGENRHQTSESRSKTPRRDR
jgi:hypothetical protein